VCRRSRGSIVVVRASSGLQPVLEDSQGACSLYLAQSFQVEQVIIQLPVEALRIQAWHC
jgi:hypothetical protein